MRINVKMNLKQAERYFDNMRRGRMKKACLSQIAISLNNNLWRYVFTNTYMVFDVPDKSTMRRLIKAKSFPPLARYNQVYLDNMIRKGKLPHGSLRQHTHIDIINDKVLFYIPSMHTLKTRVVDPMRRQEDYWAGEGHYGKKVHVYNMGPIHEKRKSILKSTIVFSWQDILKRIGNVYKTYAE